MPSEKHQQKAREIIYRHMDRSGVIGMWELLVDRIAAALEAVERETAKRCAEIARLEMAEDTGADGDIAYNHACVDVAERICAEFGITPATPEVKV